MIKQLTGIRAVLAGWVVMLHVLGNSQLPGYTPISPLLSRGYLAVDGFFVLSGFILCYVYDKKFSEFSLQTYRDYLIARLARIYPTHLLMLAAFVPVVVGNRWLKHPNDVTSFSLPDLGLSLLLIQGWGFIKHPAWNTVAWSISAEWLAYLLLPVFFVFIVKRGRKYQYVHNIAVVAACILGLHWIQIVQDGSTGQAWIYKTALMRVCTNFALGCVAYVLSHRMRSSAWLGTVGALGAVGCATIHRDELFSLCLMFTIVGLSSNSDWLSPLLSGKTMVYLGEISFAVYMLQLFLWQAVSTITLRLHGMPISSIPIMAFLVITFVLSAAVYRYVEVPARNFIRAWVLCRTRNTCP